LEVEMSEGRFRKWFKVTGNYVGPDDWAHAWFVQNVAQDVSIAVTEHHGFGTQWYRSQRSGWVMRRFDTELFRPWMLDDEILVETWLSKRKRVSVHREYRFLDARTEEVLGGGRAEWVYIDAGTARPIPLAKELEERLAFEPEEGVSPWPEGVEESLMGEPEACHTRVVGYSELDGYGHVNNTAYLRWISDLVHRGGPGEWWMRRWRIEYRRPARLGDEVRLELERGEFSPREHLCRIRIRDVADGEELVRALVVLAPRA
jgi:acyl-CoA thioester hydrolase